jgi:hypothetical protein
VINNLLMADRYLPESVVIRDYTYSELCRYLAIYRSLIEGAQVDKDYVNSLALKLGPLSLCSPMTLGLPWEFGERGVRS